jgi:hypothetical protein
MEHYHPKHETTFFFEKIDVTIRRRDIHGIINGILVGYLKVVYPQFLAI